MSAPCLKLYKIGNNGAADLSTETDITTYIADGGLSIEHEALDTEKSGRNPDTGEMERKWIANKHTLTIKLRRVKSTAIYPIFDVLHHTFFMAKYISPVYGTEITETFYCSSINYGAQRYDRYNNSIFYDGVTFKIIEK